MVAIYIRNYQYSAHFMKNITKCQIKFPIPVISTIVELLPLMCHTFLFFFLKIKKKIYTPSGQNTKRDRELRFAALGS